MRIILRVMLHPALVILIGLATSIPASAQNRDERVYVPQSAFFVGLGGSAQSIDFGQQDVIAIGTSETTQNGVTIATGFAQGPDDASGGTPIFMDSQLVFSPSVEVGYFQHFHNSKWLWGTKFTNDYIGASSNFRNPVFPQVGTYTPTGEEPVPFTGNAVADATRTQVIDQMALRPFIGYEVDNGFIYFGGGPTATKLQSDIRALVGFADINGNRSDISGAPQDFSDSGWVAGGSTEVGITHFFKDGWFIDCSYGIGITANRTFDFASTFSNTNADGVTNAGTLVGDSTWQGISQSFGIKFCKAF